MVEDLLEKLGLSPGEARAYRALLFLGASSVGPIARDAKVSRSKIYEVLDKLITKGLVSRTFQGKHKTYLAAEPTVLQELIERKEKELTAEKLQVEKLIPALLASKPLESREVELFEGFNGLKTIRERLLSSMERGDEMLVLGAPKIANELWDKWFLDFHQRREKNGVKLKIIYNADSREYGKVRTKFKLTSVRYLPKEFATPTWFDVFNDQVLLVVIGQQDKPYALLIRSSEIAQSVKNYFNLLWGISLV